MAELHHVQRAGTVVPGYLAPASLDEALSVKAEYGSAARIVAGGTDLVVELDRGAHRGVEMLVDLTRIPGLDAIGVDDRTIRLGATTTHHDVVASEACRTDALALAQACLEIGSPQLRNRATVVGNIVTASPANDTISALTALGAALEIASLRGVRSEPIGRFVNGFRTTTLADDEVVTAVTLPRPAAGRRSLFVKSGLRKAQAISVVHLAIVVDLDDDHTVTDARLALGSVAPTILDVEGFADALRGRTLSADTIDAAVRVAVDAAAPIDDLRATAEYRSAQVGVMTERALAALAADEQAARWPRRTTFLRSAHRPRPGPAGEHTALSAITVSVNGADVTAPGAVGATLLDWLRDRAHCSGVKEGCAEGECGACTVHLDGTAVMACLVPAARAAGCDVVTVEGLADDGRLAPVQQAFVDHHAVQCGFCTPGFLMSCAALLDEFDDPSTDEVRAGLSGNLCRCTGYRAIETAVATAARSRGVAS